MDSLGIAVCQVDAEGRATGKRTEAALINLIQTDSQLNNLYVSTGSYLHFDCLPIRMSNEDVCPACIFLEDTRDSLAQGVESVRSSYLRC